MRKLATFSISIAAAAYVAGFATAPVASAEQNHLLGLKVRTGVTYTDNRDNIEEGAIRAGVPQKKQDQYSYYIGPTISLTRQIDDRLDFKAGYSPVIRWYDEVSKGKEKHKVDHSVFANLDYLLSSKTRIHFSENYWWTGMRDYFYGADYDYDPNRDTRLDHAYWQNRVSASVSHKFAGEDYAKVTGRWRVKRYDEDELADYSDEDEYGARLDVMHVPSRYVAFGVFGDYMDWDRASDSTKKHGVTIDQGYTTYTLGLQGIFDFSANRDNYIYAGVGWARGEYEADELDSRDATSVMVELRLFQLSDTRLLGGLRYMPRYSDAYPFSSQEDTAAYLTLTKYVGSDRRLRLNGSVELRTRRYDLAEDIDPDSYRYGYAEALKAANNGKTKYDKDSFYARLSASYKFYEWLDGTLYYSFQKVDSDISSNYKENVVGVGANVTLY